MQEKLVEKFRWFVALWSEAEDDSTRTYRRHVRGLFVGWAIAAAAMALLEAFPNEAQLSMYSMLVAEGLPWQQQWLAALEMAGPLLMVWHLNGLRLWGKQGVAQR